MKLNKTEKRIRKDMIHKIKILLEISKEYQDINKKKINWINACYTSHLLLSLHLISFKNYMILEDIIERNL